MNDYVFTLKHYDAGNGVRVDVAIGDGYWKIVGFRECLGKEYAVGFRFSGEFDTPLARQVGNRINLILGVSGCPDEQFRRAPLERVVYSEWDGPRGV